MRLVLRQMFIGGRVVLIGGGILIVRRKVFDTIIMKSAKNFGMISICRNSYKLLISQ